MRRDEKSALGLAFLWLLACAVIMLLTSCGPRRARVEPEAAVRYLHDINSVAIQDLKRENTYWLIGPQAQRAEGLRELGCERAYVCAWQAPFIITIVERTPKLVPRKAN